MRRTVVILVVGLSKGQLGAHTPNLSALAKEGACRALRPVLPAVTSPVQATFTTGLLPREHGSVANGWYFRDLAQVINWHQSDHLVSGERIWEAARKRDSSFTCAKLFWWYNMYGSVDASVTPRPIYLADGLKLPDIYSEPEGLRDELVARLGEFPLFDFWGPNAGIKSSEWIGRSALHVMEKRRPTLTLVYLPHLDYNGQRLGPGAPGLTKDLAQIDAVVGEIIEDAKKSGTRVVVLSEYGITGVTGAVHINRALRREGLLRVRSEVGFEKLDAGASRAFAVSDHQLAHVYVREPALVGDVKRLLEGVDGIASVLDEEGKRAAGLDHPRSGELVALSAKDRWFSYYYWLDDDRAPEFARSVDIHRKPGYDPVELFADPEIRLLAAKIGWTLLKKKLGFRYMMDVIPLDTSLVKGSHGLMPTHEDEGPVFLSSEPALVPEGAVDATSVKSLILSHLFS